MIQAIGTIPEGRYRAKHVARSEVAKMMTLRSTAVMFGFTVVASLLITGLVANQATKHPASYFRFGWDPTQSSLVGLVVACLIGGVFGALMITGEHASGTIRTTLTANPRRGLLLGTKIAVVAVATFVFCEALSFASFFLGQAILSGSAAPSANLGSPGALRAVTMTGAFVALICLMSFGLGIIFRSTAAAIAAFVAVIFVLPLVMHGISQADDRYLPANILTNSVMATTNQGPNNVSPGLGLALMAMYAAIALGIGAVLFVRRDA